MAVRARSFADRDEAHRYEELDRILDVAEPALHAIATEYGLHQARIDRWRWDQPEVVLSWIDRCSVEVNAWRDERDNGGRPVRRWKHEAIGSWQTRGTEDVSVDRGRIAETLWKSYETVAGWDVKSLTKKHYPRLA